MQKHLNHTSYLDTILTKSAKYLKGEFTTSQLQMLMESIAPLRTLSDTKAVVEGFEMAYYKLRKAIYQNEQGYNEKIDAFLQSKAESQKMIWGDCLEALKAMKSESIGAMVTSPPYYNARAYAQWTNIDDYLNNMESILKECYRVLDNHRAFVFNIGDIFDNDGRFTRSTWGKRRLPLGAYFIMLFEKVGFSFVDDIIWDKGQVQSQRHKNGDRPYPYHQYPLNCYEHILVFHKHRLDTARYPCPVCGCLQTNGNAY